MKRRIISAILIILGISIIIYPKTFQIYNDRKSEKIMKEWEELLAIIDNEDKGHNSSLLDFLDMEKAIYEGQKEQRELEKKVEQEKARELYIKDHMEGVLTIDKINLRLPILKGVTVKNLNISVSSMKESGKPGEKGNYVIAGHRSHTYGRQFNRLDELDIDDIIKISDGENEYEYIVKEKTYVLPEEMKILTNKTKKEITLVTCNPMINPTHRLLVKGEILE